jgi:acetyl-CoA acetyltransferase
MTTAYIQGVGMHPFGRFPDKSLRRLSSEAVVAALRSSGHRPADIDIAFFANSLGGLLVGQESIRGEVCLHDAGIHGIPIINVENACASGSTALWNAVRAVRSGEFHTALAVGAEKMFVDDRERTLAALRTASDVAMTGGQALQFVGVYTMRLQAYLASGAITPHHLAAVTVKNQRNGSLNPMAQFGKLWTEEEVLTARKISGPITIPMVAGISDGAAAVIVSATPRADAGVAIRASVLRTGSVDGLGESSVDAAIRQAYEAAGCGPEDLSLVEVHDATSPGELLYYEKLGLCAEGEAGVFFDSGATQISGKIPVNTSGGLSARGHPIGATGLAQISELYWQLTGRAAQRQVDDATLALAQNSGGWLDGDTAACCVHVLERTH